MWFLLSLLFSGLKNQETSAIPHMSSPLTPFIIFVALLMLSNSLKSFCTVAPKLGHNAQAKAASSSHICSHSHSQGECIVLGDNHLPQPASSALLDAPQNTVGFLIAWTHHLFMRTLLLIKSPPSPFQWGCFTVSHSPAYMYSQGCPPSAAESSTCSH